MLQVKIIYEEIATFIKSLNFIFDFKKNLLMNKEISAVNLKILVKLLNRILLVLLQYNILNEIYPLKNPKNANSYY